MLLMDEFEPPPPALARVEREFTLLEAEMAEPTLLPALVASEEAAPRTRLNPLLLVSVLLKPLERRLSVFFIFSARIDWAREICC